MGLRTLSRRPCGPLSRRALGVLGFALLLAACGDREPPGSGRLDGRRLVLEGPPEGLGARHARLVKAEAAAARSALLDGAFADPARGTFLRDANGLYARETLRLLPERARQELGAFAREAGLREEDALLPEVARDGLRWHEAARLLGGALWADAEGTRAAWTPEGPDAALLAERWMLVDRRPDGRRRTVVVAWPGALGGVAGASDAGLAVLSAESPAEVARQTLKGAPFGISLRLALEEATDAADLLRRLARTTAHEVVVLSPREATKASRRVVDMVDVEPKEPPPGGAEPPRAAVVVRWAGDAFVVELRGPDGAVRASASLGAGQ